MFDASVPKGSAGTNNSERRIQREAMARDDFHTVRAANEVTSDPMRMKGVQDHIAKESAMLQKLGTTLAVPKGGPRGNRK
jgi:hypothetical protein